VRRKKEATFPYNLNKSDSRGESDGFVVGPGGERKRGGRGLSQDRPITTKKKWLTGTSYKEGPPSLVEKGREGEREEEAIDLTSQGEH